MCCQQTFESDGIESRQSSLNLFYITMYTIRSAPCNLAELLDSIACALATDAVIFVPEMWLTERVEILILLPKEE